jgi:glycine cleavage system aminomethyltransferase T
MLNENLEEKLRRIGDPVTMLRNAPSKRFRFDYPDQYTTWQEEQQAWTSTAVFFDQSHHMTDVYFRGPDVKRLLADTGTNSFATFGRDKAKHFVTCNEDGRLIGTAVLFGLEENEVNLVGPTAAANWLQYHVETGGYDVEVTRDERTAENPGKRLTFRYEIEGPRAWDILEKAHGGPIDRFKFFTMKDLTLGDVRVRALSHTMAGVPGSESIGLEIFGPVADGPACREAILAAGEEFGLAQGGALAYYTGGTESGYPAQPTPAIYTGERMKPYREWLRGDGYEGKLSIGGSFRSERIEDYYVTPWQFGYGHLVKFDHDFIGRAALEKLAEQQRRTKVWLKWNDKDVARIYASSLFDGEKRAKYLDTPLARYARVHVDSVLIGDELVGRSTMSVYTVNVGSWMSVGFVDEAHVRDGAEVVIVWGEEGGGTAKKSVERHVQTTIRATMSTRPLAG